MKGRVRIGEAQASPGQCEPDARNNTEDHPGVLRLKTSKL